MEWPGSRADVVPTPQHFVQKPEHCLVNDVPSGLDRRGVAPLAGMKSGISFAISSASGALRPS